ncbi:MAG: hypothetical protein ACI976_002201 [Aureispira sp.]|jgi:hypothetical protein
MEKNSEQQQELEKIIFPEKKSLELPYFQEDSKDLPKDYNATVERLKTQLEQSEPTSTEGNVLFGIALTISFVLLFVHLMDFLAYPRWMELLHDIVIFVEASIPFVVSFFLKNRKYATLTRLIGVIVLVTYLLTL